MSITNRLVSFHIWHTHKLSVDRLGKKNYFASCFFAVNPCSAHRGQKVKIKGACAIRIMAILLFFFFASEPELWPAEEQKNTTQQKRSSVSQSKKRAKETKKHRKKDTHRNKKGDTVPMPPLDDAPFAAQVPLLPVLKEAKILLSKEKVSFSSIWKDPCKTRTQAGNRRLHYRKDQNHLGV